jgi:hypothetical protein
MGILAVFLVGLVAYATIKGAEIYVLRELVR